MKKLIVNILLFLFIINLNAQVGINTDNSPPHPSAQLDVKNPNKGLLLPRVTSPASAISGPAAGLMVYDQANANLAYYNGAQWSNLTGIAGNEGLYSRFPHSKSFITYYKTGAENTQDFDFVVPASITKVWVEAWGGGQAGGIAPGSGLSAPNGGAGGDFASFLIDVVPGTTMWIKVSKGGHTGGSYSNSQIFPNKTTLGNYVDIGYGSFNLFKFFGTIAPELIAFHGGDYTTYSTISFQVYNGTYVIVYDNAEGGGAYPSYLRTKSNTFVYNANTNALINFFGGNYIGYIPGGGAPAGSDTYGGPGQVIVHW